MEYIEQISNIFSSIGGLGFLVGVVVLWKVGLLEFLLNIKKNGNGKQDEINKDLFEHIKDIKDNHLGHIKNQITSVETKIDIIMRHLKL